MWSLEGKLRILRPTDKMRCVGLDISLDDSPPPNGWQRSVNALTWSLLIQIHILRCVLGLFYLKSELGNLNDHQQIKQIKKTWYIYNTMEYYCYKKEWNNAICSNIEEPRDYHTKWSQRKTNVVHPLYVESKKLIQMDLFTKQKLTHWHEKHFSKGKWEAIN